MRACESRMDLMRAVIVGAEGTPYHDGVFFFDIHFPDTYPSVPPVMSSRTTFSTCLLFFFSFLLMMTFDFVGDRWFITILVGLESTQIYTTVVKYA